MERYCPNCGGKCDEATGLCPQCDSAQLEAFREILEESKNEALEFDENNVKSEMSGSVADDVEPLFVEEDEAEAVRKKGIIAIILSFLAIILIVTVVMVGVSKGWIGGKAKRAQLKSAYTAYLNTRSVPEYKLFDAAHPQYSDEGIFSAGQLDLNHDNSDEFIVAYYDKNNDEISLRLSCFEYNTKSIIQGRSDTGDGTQGVELNATVTAFTVPDYNSELISEERPPFETCVYTVKAKDSAYVAVEHLTYGEGCSYEMHIFGIDGGVFKELANIKSDDISNDGSIIVYSDLLPAGKEINNDGFDASSLDFWEYVEENYKDASVLYLSNGDGSFQYNAYYSSADAALEDFCNTFGMKKKQYIDRENKDGQQFKLLLPDEKSRLFTNSYYVKTEGEESEAVYTAKDYTDYVALLYPDNKTAYDTLVSKNDEKKKADAENAKVQKTGDVPFGDIVKIGSDLYYWKYNGKSFSSKPTAGGAYDYKVAGENDLICRSADGEETTVLTTNGAGPLAIAGGKIFYQQVASGYNSFNIYSCYLDGSNKSYIDEGHLCGAVQDGAYVIYATGSDERKFDSIKSVKTEDKEETTIAYNARFLFTYDDRVYYQAEEEGSHDARCGMTTLCSVNGNGSSNRAIFYTQPDLYEEPDYDATRTYIIHPYVYNDYVYFAYGRYRDSGPFEGGALAKCKLDGSEGEVVGTTKTDTFTLDTKGNVYSAEDEKYVNGYTYADGELRQYHPASDTVEALVTKADYSAYSDLSLGEEGEQLLSLVYLQEADGKYYFTLSTGKHDGDEDGNKLYAYRTCALFEKDRKTGTVQMLYQSKEASTEDE